MKIRSCHFDLTENDVMYSQENREYKFGAELIDRLLHQNLTFQYYTEVNYQAHFVQYVTD